MVHEREMGAGSGSGHAHTPVMLDRVVEVFAPAVSNMEAPVIVDATLGMGGHTSALLATYPALTVIGLDRDPQAIERSTARLVAFKDRVKVVPAIYDEIVHVVQEQGYKSVTGVLFDLGVSSLQLDEASRGFAYAQDAPLDMRMNATTGTTAQDIVNTYSAAELARIISQYGEERFARRVAAAIVKRREASPLTSSAELAELVRDAIPAPARRTGGHPAKRTFQALRIEVNRELEVLSAALPAALSVLAVGGRIAVLSYHSLEDRIVKRAFAPLTTDTTPQGLPVQLPGTGPQLRLITRGAEAPTAQEIATNPRAASARFRVAERIREAS